MLSARYVQIDVIKGKTGENRLVITLNGKVSIVLFTLRKLCSQKLLAFWSACTSQTVCNASFNICIAISITFANFLRMLILRCSLWYKSGRTAVEKNRIIELLM